MANPLACAAANASLDLFETEDRLGQVAAISAGLEDAWACRALPGVRTCGAGGHRVVELEQLNDPKALQRQCVEAGIWVRPFRNIVYLTPSFTIGADDLAILTGTIARILAA